MHAPSSMEELNEQRTPASTRSTPTDNEFEGRPLQNRDRTITPRRSQRIPGNIIESSKISVLEAKIINKVQTGLREGHAGDKGRGIFATEEFAQGAYVVTYEGDILTHEEAKEKGKEYELSGAGSYVFEFEFKNKKVYIDATPESDNYGKFGRLVNHSKNGNCKPVLQDINDRPYIYLQATKVINIDDEILFDYADRSRQSVVHNPWLG